MRNDSVSEATLELFDLACNSDLGRVVGYSEVDQEIAAARPFHSFPS